MKSLSEVDLQDWELLPDEGYLEIRDGDGDGGTNSCSRKRSQSHSVFEMNYFDIRPPTPKSKSSHQFIHTRSQIVTVPIVLEPAAATESSPEQLLVKKENSDEFDMHPCDEEIIKNNFNKGGDEDLVSQVFFKKMKEAEFVDMKVESPKSNSGSGGRGFLQPPPIQYEEDNQMEKKVEFQEDGTGGPNLWKWSLNGTGAICSFGLAAAATFCVIIFSTGHHHNQKLRFQIYTGDNDNKVVAAARGVNGGRLLQQREGLMGRQGFPSPGLTSPLGVITINAHHASL